MVACPRCGSRRVYLVRNPWSVVVHLLSDERRTACPNCDWRGWKHANEWRLATAEADASSLVQRRLAKARRRWIQLGVALLLLAAGWAGLASACAN